MKPRRRSSETSASTVLLRNQHKPLHYWTGTLQQSRSQPKAKLSQPLSAASGGASWVDSHPHHALVPPTVRPSIRKVGWPTPTGTPWPSLPQVPTPSSRRRSLPIIVTLVSASGPLPIKVAPFTAGPILPSSIRYASDAENTNLPEVISTWPPPKWTA